MLTNVNSASKAKFIATFVINPLKMSRKYFRNISILAIVSLLCLAVVQSVWVYRMYNDSVTDFKRRVESSIYKSIYKAFRMDAIPGLADAEYVKINLDDFSLYFEPNLMELDALQPYYAEVLFNDGGDLRVVMTKGERPVLNNPMTTVVPIDDDGLYSLLVCIETPFEVFLGRMWGLIASSVAIIILLAGVLIYLVRTMFRQKTLEEMRRDFTHNITHELKTPISVAVTATDALRNFSADADPDRRSRYLEIVEMQLTQLSTMVEHILSVSVEGREYKYNPTVVYLQEIISGLTQGAGINTGKKPVFNIDCAEHIKILADEFHIKNLLATVIDNAVKYSAEPVIDIKVSDKTENVTVEIKDNGCGISKEHLSHVFEKFYRVPTGDIHTVRGYGLGLYYAKQVAELHRGTISMKSRIGEGTTVTIKLPRNEQ
ncbi:MAG: HAMP domain-containing histidine kinase [Bacteroidales bacterium]|nr:HAMP domain-containing histidine kinase [Bacteroidales bacterium]